jgi:hypothetical protein
MHACIHAYIYQSLAAGEEAEVGDREVVEGLRHAVIPVLQCHDQRRVLAGQVDH